MLNIVLSHALSKSWVFGRLSHSIQTDPNPKKSPILTQNVPKTEQTLKKPQKTCVKPLKTIDKKSRKVEGGMRYVPRTRINTGDFAPAGTKANDRTRAAQHHFRTNALSLRTKEQHTMAKGMTKTALVRHMAEKLEITNKQAAAGLELLADTAVKETKKNGEFTIPGIGKLVKAERKARLGRNPQTGETIKIKAKTVVKFRVAKVAKDTIAPPKK
jgi:DNA-binding protein HU-beta